MVLTGMKLDVETLAARYGMESAQRMYAASLASIAFVEQMVSKRISIATSHARAILKVPASSHISIPMPGRWKWSAASLGRFRVVSKKDLRSELVRTYFGGIVDDVSAGLNPARYVCRIGRAALGAGAAVFENASVQHIARASENSGSGFQLNTSRGRVFARDVFIATSGYTSSATPALRKKTFPSARSPSPPSRYPMRWRGVKSAQSHDLRFPGTTCTTTALLPTIACCLAAGLRSFPRLPTRYGAALRYYGGAWSGFIPNCATPSWNTPRGGSSISASTPCLTPDRWTGSYRGGIRWHGVAMATYGSQIAEQISGGQSDNP